MLLPLSFPVFPALLPDPAEKHQHEMPEQYSFTDRVTGSLILTARSRVGFLESLSTLLCSSLHVASFTVKRQGSSSEITQAARSFGMEKSERPFSLSIGLQNFSDPPVKIFSTIKVLHSLTVITVLKNISD